MEFCLMGCLHKTSIWEDNSRSLLYLNFIYTRRFYFYVVFCCTSIFDYIRRVICGWVPSTFITFVIVLY